MKHINEKFVRNLKILGESNVYGITICSMYRNFIKDLFKKGFTISEIVTIFNFLFYELDIEFQLKYHHIYYCIKRYCLNNRF